MIYHKNKIIVTVWAGIAILTFVLFDFYSDPAVVIVSGNLILDGHFFDLYEKIENIFGNIGIYPILYPIIYAVWNLPIRLITGESFLDINKIPIIISYWNKILIVLFYFLTGGELKKVINKINFKNIENADKLWYYLPIPFFVVFFMGMYDIIYVYFMVLGLRYFYSDWTNKKNKYLFIIMYGISICFKTLPIFYFIPLLLMKEKKIQNIILDGVIFLIPYIFCIIPFLGSSAFVKNCLKFSGSSSNSMLNISTIGNINILIVILLILYGYAFFYVSKKDSTFTQKTISICNYTSCIIFGLSIFHPQWFLMAMPFFVLLILNSTEETFNIILLIQFLIAFTFYMIFSIRVEDFANEWLFYRGGLGYRGLQILKLNPYMSINKFFIIKDLKVVNSIFLGLLLCFVLYSCAKGQKLIQKLSKLKLLFFMVASISAYAIPAVMCYLPIFPRYIYESNLDYVNGKSGVQEIKREEKVKQHFNIDSDTCLNKIIIRTITWNNTYNPQDKLIIQLKSEGETKILYSGELLLEKLPDNDLVTLDMPNIKLKKGNYYLEFFLETENSNTKFALSKIEKNNNDSGKLSISDHILDNEVLQICIIGKDW